MKIYFWDSPFLVVTMEILKSLLNNFLNDLLTYLNTF